MSDRLETKAPRRKVVAARDTATPGGGKLWLLRLECGHAIWNRRGRGLNSTPPKSADCFTCWLDANPDAV